MTVKNGQLITLAAVFLLQYFFGHIFPQNKRLNNWKNDRFNLSIGILNLVLSYFPSLALVYLLAYIDEKSLGLLKQFHLPYWLTIMLTVLILDVWMYAWHRLNHTIPFLWKFHRFHHKDEKMNSTTAIRFHIVELLFSLPGKAAIYLLAGLSFTPVLIYEIFFFVSIVVHHSNIYISEKVDGVYRALFASPLMHRIHHSKRKEERNTNYGALFSFWDKLFRTWKIKTKEPVVFGVEE